MQEVVLLIHLFLGLSLVIVVLLQRSEGGALGIGGGSMGGLVSVRGSANLLTRATGVLAACFISTSILLAILAGNAQPKRSIIDAPATSAPAQPLGPTVPLAK
ncbi:MAG: preprotein translocase subunit SecG [Alphaproteobacteria bacterium]